MAIYKAKTKEYAQVGNSSAKVAEAYASPTLAFPTLHATSGTLVADLPSILPGDRFEPAAVKVTGLPFAGKLKHFSGVAVREVPEVVNADGTWGGTPGSQRGFILDFGGMRSVLRLLRSGSTLVYNLVLPWQGTDFAPASLYPPQANATPKRTPHATGASQISLRGAETQKLYVQVKNNIALDQFLDQCVLETLVFPANLRASVTDRPPFWTHPGPLQGETDMLGLAEALSSLAADITAPLAPKLTLQSDAPGVLQLPASFAFLSAEKSAAASWAGSPSTAVELRAGVPGTFPLHLSGEDDGKTWVLRSLKLEAAATLSPWILEAATPDPQGSRAALRIDARLSAGQGFLADHAVELHGVGLHLAAPKGAELSVELQGDDAGRPATGEALASRMLAIGAEGGEVAWHEVLFEAPLVLEVGAAYWITAKAKSGAALWTVTPAADDQTARYAEDGTAWQPFPRMLPAGSAPASPAPVHAPAPAGKTPVAYPAAALRIFRAPLPEENQARVIVSHANGSSVVEMALPVSDEAMEVEWLWPEAGRPELPPGGDGRRIDLDIRSLAGGSLDIAAATVFYAWKEA